MTRHTTHTAGKRRHLGKGLGGKLGLGQRPADEGVGDLDRSPTEVIQGSAVRE
jgi:hypothetical protein